VSSLLGHLLGSATFAGAGGNGREAPETDLRSTMLGLPHPTQLGSDAADGGAAAIATSDPRGSILDMVLHSGRITG
jgi:hypothetical protein